MRDAAQFIAASTRGLSIDDYVGNQQVRWSVERAFEVIGEALSQLAKREPTLASQVSEYAKIISFRNLLIHAYSNVNHTITWSVIQTDLPLLQQELHDLLT